MSTIMATACAEHVERLELRGATMALFTTLFPGGRPPTDPGRLQLLTAIIEKRAVLRQALHAGDGDRFRAEWVGVLAENAGNPEFLQTLAVLYREQALEASHNGVTNEPYWVVATGLWALLLSSERFWSSFWDRRDMPDQVGPVLYECIKSTVAPQGKLARQEFAAGRYGAAGVHLRCLEMCRLGVPALTEAIGSYGMPCKLKPDKARLARVQAAANSLIEEWAGSLVREAERLTEDAGAIQRLPEGIRKDYAAGIARLQPFIDLGVPQLAVLSTSLRLHNEWCYDLHLTQQSDRIRELMAPAREIAERLVPLSTEMQSYRPENDALSEHFMLRGYTCDDSDEAIQHYMQALAWNSNNRSAANLKQSQVRDVRIGQLNRAIEYSQQGQWDEAYQILDSVEGLVEDSDRGAVDNARAVVQFNQAQHLAADGDYKRALRLAKQAVAVVPGERVVVEFVRECERLAPEEANIRHLHAGREALDEDRFDAAIEAARKVPRTSTLSEQAGALQAAAHFYRGLNHANADRFDRAIPDLEAAVKLVSDDENRRHIQRQLAAVRAARRNRALEGALQRQDWPEAERTLRSHLADPSLAPDEHREVQKELAMVLVARAVDMVNANQENERRFGQALADVLARLQRRPEVA